MPYSRAGLKLPALPAGGSGSGPGGLAVPSPSEVTESVTQVGIQVEQEYYVQAVRPCAVGRIASSVP